MILEHGIEMGESSTSSELVAERNGDGRESWASSELVAQPERRDGKKKGKWRKEEAGMAGLMPWKRNG